MNQASSGAAIPAPNVGDVISNTLNQQHADRLINLADMTDDPGVPSFFGIPTFSKSVVFVIDTSSSMSGELDPLKRRLKRSIDNLPAATSFSIVAFGSEANTWNSGLTSAQELKVKQNAKRWVDSLETGGGTNMRAGLLTAFRMRPTTIFLLSDGSPNKEEGMLAWVKGQTGLDYSPVINTIALPGSNKDLMRKVSRYNRKGVLAIVKR